MLKRKELKGLKELYEKYQISGNPLHLTMIWMNYGLPGALYLKKFDVAATMIKKSPEKINEIDINENDKNMLYQMLLNDFKNQVGKLENLEYHHSFLEDYEIEEKEKALKTIAMIIDIVKKLEIKPYTKEIDKMFIFNIYEEYCKNLKKGDYVNLEILEKIIYDKDIKVNEIIKISFNKRIHHSIIDELCDMTLNVTHYGETFIEFTKILIKFYLKIKFVKNYNIKRKEDEDVKNFESSELKLIETINESVDVPGTKTLIKLVTLLNRMEIRFPSYDLINDDDGNPDEEKKEFLEEVIMELREKIKDHIVDRINYTLDEIYERRLQDSLDELKFEDGLKRVSLYLFLRQQMPGYERFYDVSDEKIFVDKLDIEI